MAMTRQQILALTAKLVVSIRPDLRETDITEHTTLDTLGLDSVTLVELSVRVEEEFGDSVDLDAWVDQQTAGGSALTVGSLVTFIELAIDLR